METRPRDSPVHKNTRTGAQGKRSGCSWLRRQNVTHFSVTESGLSADGSEWGRGVNVCRLQWSMLDVACGITAVLLQMESGTWPECNSLLDVEKYSEMLIHHAVPLRRRLGLNSFRYMTMTPTYGPSHKGPSSADRTKSLRRDVMASTEPWSIMSVWEAQAAQAA